MRSTPALRAADGTLWQPVCGGFTAANKSLKAYLKPFPSSFERALPFETDTTARSKAFTRTSDTKVIRCLTKAANGQV